MTESGSGLMESALARPNASPPLGRNAVPVAGPIDLHVHLVGNGSSGSGCELKLSGWHGLVARALVWQLGLPQAALTGDLDRMYLDQLLAHVRGSGLSHAVILAQDRVHDRDGNPRPDAGTFFVPNDCVLDLADRHPELLAGISIHPARTDALPELERCLVRGAVLLKLNPVAQDIDCGDPSFLPFFDRLAAAKLPLLAHTGGEYTIRAVRPESADPRRLALPLQRGVTVIAAHGAASYGPRGRDYLPDLLRLLDEYPNLYVDNSAFNTPLISRAYATFLSPSYRDRVLHGSDFPVGISSLPAWVRNKIPWRTMVRESRRRNPLERDRQIKLAAGFPAATFTRAAVILRLPAPAPAAAGPPGSAPRTRE